jgi:hypothetical protein
MEWDELKEYIRMRILPHSRAAGRVSNWIDALQSTIDHSLIASCIGVDLLSGAVEAERFARVLDEVNPSIKDPCTAFDDALDRSPDRSYHVCSSKHPRPPIADGDYYVRVLTIAEFITYYAGPVYGFTLDAADVAEVRRRFLGSASPTTTLEDIDRWWEGSLPSVWVTAESDIKKVITTSGSATEPTALLDALGLPGKAALPGERIEVLTIQYPVGFDRNIPCRQPSTLDTRWQLPVGFYISYKRLDGWGRTQSCTGLIPGIRERVHSHFKGLTSAYCLSSLGFADDPARDRLALQSEAERRVGEIFPSHGSP